MLATELIDLRMARIEAGSVRRFTTIPKVVAAEGVGSCRGHGSSGKWWFSGCVLRRRTAAFADIVDVGKRTRSIREA